MDLLECCGVIPQIPSFDEFASSLYDADLVIATTREFNTPYEMWELEAIQDFVTAGKSLLHLSNHAPFPINDTILAERFGYKFQNTFYIHNSFNHPYSVHLNLELTKQIGIPAECPAAFSINNCTGIEIIDPRFLPFAHLSSEVINKDNSEQASGEIFAIAGERNATSGRIVAIGDSGLIGVPMTRFPGPGLDSGDNNRLMKAVISWLVSK
jgi:hypothetical protein